MSFLTDEEIDSLAINRMIFHVVGKGLQTPIYLKEISPPLYPDFFLERIKISLKGNLFEFLDFSNVERILRIISNTADQNPNCFSDESKQLATDFHSHHTGNASKGVFLLFELTTILGKLYALIKYENEDVVRYVLEDDVEVAHVPKLERFSESFVKKADAIQKVALVRFNEKSGGQVIVLDRSNRSHISDYFEKFLLVKRVNTETDLTKKLIAVLKKVFKENAAILPDVIKREGINRIYSHLKSAEFEFNTSEPSVSLSVIFGNLTEDSPILTSFNKEAKSHGILGESFIIRPENITSPKRRKIVTEENVIIIFDDNIEPTKTPLADGRTEIKIITAGITLDDFEP